MQLLLIHFEPVTDSLNELEFIGRGFRTATGANEIDRLPPEGRRTGTVGTGHHSPLSPFGPAGPTGTAALADFHMTPRKRHQCRSNQTQIDRSPTKCPGVNRGFITRRQAAQGTPVLTTTFKPGSGSVRRADTRDDSGAGQSCRKPLSSPVFSSSSSAADAPPSRTPSLFMTT